LGCGQLSVGREAANRVTINCWYQRRCGAFGVHLRWHRHRSTSRARQHHCVGAACGTLVDTRGWVRGAASSSSFVQRDAASLRGVVGAWASKQRQRVQRGEDVQRPQVTLCEIVLRYKVSFRRCRFPQVSFRRCRFPATGDLGHREVRGAEG
jgi:hypothetical protein